MKHLYDKDVVSGLMFVAIGIFSLSMSLQFDFGTTARPGPGFFPTILSTLLIAIGAGVALVSMRSPVIAYANFVWRPFFFITLAVVLFAFTINRFGLVPSVVLATITASFAMPGYGTVPRLAVAALLALFSAGLFVGLLNLPIAIWSF